MPPSLSRLHPLLFSLLLLLCLALCAASDSPAAIRLPSEADPLCLEPRPDSCPVNCFRPAPVCGEDGVTYWCGCADAACAGARVAKMGFCEVGNGGSAPVSGQALLLIHIVWLIVLGFSVLCGFF